MNKEESAPSVWEKVKTLASRAWFRWAKIAVGFINAALAIVAIILTVLFANNPDKKLVAALTSSHAIQAYISLAVSMLFLNVLDAVSDVALSEIREKLKEAESSERIARISQRLAERERSNAVRDLQDYFDANLRVLADSLKFKTTERISVYEFKEGGFGLIGRYSLNRERRQAGQRSSYPIEQGIVGLAWAGDGNVAFVDNLPDPSTDLDEYCAIVEDLHKIPKDEVRKLRMKSRTLSGHLILDSLGDGPVAVIVFESLRPKAFTREEMADAFSQDETRLKYYLEQRRPQPWRHQD